METLVLLHYSLGAPFPLQTLPALGANFPPKSFSETTSSSWEKSEMEARVLFHLSLGAPFSVQTASLGANLFIKKV